MQVMYIDIKSEGQTVREALGLVQIAIDECRFAHIPVIKILHGYGSHGVGGAIKVELKKMLREYMQKKMIKDFINCEKWTDSNPQKQKATKLCPDLLGDIDLFMPNSGISLVIL